MEMMNWPGVLSGDEEVLKKIELARRFGKVVDGHAPGLKGEEARRYIAPGITTDQLECFTAEEALDKMRCSSMVECARSAAKDFDALCDLLHDHSAMMMFCTDDAHPNYLARRHIDDQVRRAPARSIR